MEFRLPKDFDSTTKHLKPNLFAKILVLHYSVIYYKIQTNQHISII